MKKLLNFVYLFVIFMCCKYILKENYFFNNIGKFLIHAFSQARRVVPRVGQSCYCPNRIIDNEHNKLKLMLILAEWLDQKRACIYFCKSSL